MEADRCARAEAAFSTETLNSLFLLQTQASFETIYRLSAAPKITDFLLYETSPTVKGRREELQIRESDALEIGVILDPEMVGHARRHPLCIDNFPAYCSVVEGISHFLMLVHRAAAERPTTQLELEVQAEIDKYIAALLVAERSELLASDSLRTRLYSAYTVLDGLEPHEASRYHRANRLAKLYTRRLEGRFVQSAQITAMVQELRIFYRMPRSEKFALISS